MKVWLGRIILKKKNYNKLITVKNYSHNEKMKRTDHLYDLILVIEYNTKK